LAPTTPEELAREWAKAQDVVFAFIGSLAPAFGEAEELLQETAAQAFAQAERYDRSRPFLPWALGIARYVVLEHRRKLAKDRHVFDAEIVSQLASAFDELSDRADAAYRALSVCREKLSARSKEMIRLRYHDNLLPKDIGARIGISPGTVRVMMNRIRQELRVCIERRLRQEGLL
jgi:RNA polymerase sigma-70 factor (ECF subfamily)